MTVIMFKISIRFSNTVSDDFFTFARPAGFKKMGEPQVSRTVNPPPPPYQAKLPQFQKWPVARISRLRRKYNTGKSSFRGSILTGCVHERYGLRSQRGTVKCKNKVSPFNANNFKKFELYSYLWRPLIMTLQRPKLTKTYDCGENEGSNGWASTQAIKNFKN